jgi:hypothetical protein
MVLTLVIVLGLTTLIRVAETGREDLRAVQGMNRVRRGYFEICPAVIPYFSTSDRDDLEGIVATYDGPPEGSSMTGAASIIQWVRDRRRHGGPHGLAVGGALAGVVSGVLGAPFIVALLIGVGAFLVLVGLITALVLRSVMSFGSGLEVRFPSRSAEEGAPQA